MAKIDRAAERERLDRIFDEIAGKMPEEPRKTQKEIDEENRRARIDRLFDEITGKMPEEPRKTQKEIDEENRRARIDRLSSQDPAEFVASVDDRIRTKAFKTDWEEILCRQYQKLFKLAKVPGYLNAEVTLYRHFVAGVISELDRCTGLAKEQDNHHYYKVFTDYVRKHLEKL